MTNKKLIQWITRTAILVAITVLWQSLRYVIGSNPATTYLIGSLVNMTLIVATCTVGFASGATIAVLSSLIALMQGHTNISMVAYIMAANLALVAVFGLLKNMNWTIKALLSAILKFLIIGFGFVMMVVYVQAKPMSAALSLVFSTQVVQIVTAIIGAIVAIPVIKAVQKNIK